MRGSKARSAAAAALATISACTGLVATANAATRRGFFGVIPSGQDSLQQTHRIEARFLSRTYRILIAARQPLTIERAVWHSWQDGGPDTPWSLHMGLIHQDDSAKPSLTAYAQLPR